MSFDLTTIKGRLVPVLFILGERAFAPSPSAALAAT
jgi:hypothetical protein